jgi:lipopolysaccharide/colanic/teichoic acid biosynthesis glycosyltransferase
MRHRLSHRSGAVRERFPLSKRATDLVLCLLALVVLGPVMLAVALLIKLSSGSPVFYKAPRAGYKGRPFHELKFRTMFVGSDRQGAFTSKNDKRILPCGRLIRLLKLDELPQIFNILRGEMSVVGPRPEDLSIVDECYDERQRQVLDVRPGLTGIPQVRFFPELSIIDPHGMDAQQYYRDVILPMRLELDLEYVRRQSFWFDAALILQTIYLVAVKSWSILLFGIKPLDLSQSQS